MSSIESAFAWEIWRRHRAAALAVPVLLLTAGLFTWWTRLTGRPIALAESIGYTTLVLTLFGAFGCLHFTEGRRRGGFGSFPTRLFQLPVGTVRLVALPMAYGTVTVVGIYLAGSVLLLAPLGRMPPILWPCVYLASALTLFQTVIWSFPESRYGKLFLLSFAATLIGGAWMFFLPHVIEGTLSELGYTGSTTDFQRTLLMAFAASIPLCFGFSLHRVRRQRHGRNPRLQLALHPTLRRTSRPRVQLRPFHSKESALFWNEWRRTGLLLPAVVGIILVLTGVPACLAGDLSGPATVWLLVWFILTPLLLGAVLGTGFCKPDFWSEDLRLPTFHAARPFASGAWVLAKLKVAALSALVAWSLVAVGGFVCVSAAGDLQGLLSIADRLRLPTPHHTIALILLSGFTLILLSWRFLTLHLWAGLSGWTTWHRIVSGLTAGALVGLFVWMISQDGSDGNGLHPYAAWTWLARHPYVPYLALLLKAVLSGVVWHRVHSRRLLSTTAVMTYLVGWLLATGLVAALPLVALAGQPWPPGPLLAVALLAVPLATPGLATLTFARNRSSS